jgi:hypothetical protein
MASLCRAQQCARDAPIGDDQYSEDPQPAKTRGENGRQGGGAIHAERTLTKQVARNLLRRPRDNVLIADQAHLVCNEQNLLAGIQRSRPATAQGRHRSGDPRRRHVGESLHGIPPAGTQTMKILSYHTEDGAIHYGYAHMASLALIDLIAEANKRIDSRATPKGARGIAEVYKTINALFLAAGRRAGKLNILVKIAVLACLIVAASLARAEGQSIFIPSPPATSISTKTQGSSSSSVDLNQAAMSQIINQLNQRQSRLSVTAAQARTSAQRSVFVPQKIIIKAK